MLTTLYALIGLPADRPQGGRALPLGLLLLGVLTVTACAGEEPHYLLPLPPSDMATGTPDGGAAGLPCEVAKLLADRCASCHGQPPAGAPMALTTYADLTAKSQRDPQKTNAERALARMQDSGDPMPPGPTATVPQSELLPMQAWVAAGMPAATCQTMAKDPLNDPPICTSMKYWTMGEMKTPLMHPGRACVACHTMKKDGPKFEIAGTVYPTGHEPDDCLGGPKAPAMDDVTIEITDNAGVVRKLKTNAAANGNFTYLSKTDHIALPYRAKVIYNGHERVMNTPQMIGDCNSCHTADPKGAAGARITLPF